MEINRNLKRTGNKALVVLGLWTVVVLLISSIALFSTVQEGMPVNILEIIGYEFLCITPWIVLTPLLLWVARTYRFESDTLYVSVGVHLAMIVVIFGLHTLVQSYVVSIQYGFELNREYLERDFLGFMDMRVMLYVGILLAVYSIDFHKKDREIQLKEPRLRAELDRAKFQTLLNQIQPDFLLNTIDAISESLSRDPEESETILTDFSDLLRVMLNNADREMITIYEDLKSYDLYVNILQKRLGYTFQKKKDVETSCYDALIPSFIMMIPLVEEIIHNNDQDKKHIESLGYKARKSAGKVYLQAVITGRKLPVKEISELFRRAGIPEIISRLQQGYGQKMHLGTKVENNIICINLTVPWMVAEDDYLPMWATELNTAGKKQ